MRRQRPNGLKPTTEALEDRKLLAGILRGVDIDGDRWVLRLRGPGDLSVTNQPSSQNKTVPLGQKALIDTISISGTDPQRSRLEGKVYQASGGDGKVFFAQFQQFGGRSTEFGGSNLGTLAIDMPHFWLGQTSTSSTAADPEILLTYGVATLRFGGVDTTFTPPGGTPLNQNGQADAFTVRMGLPFTWGSSIVVDQVITSAQAAASSTTQPTQDSVTFLVHGRLNVFQANQIKGSTQFPSTGLRGGGGTLVFVTPSRSDVLDDEIASTDAANANATGAIGFVRVGGAATNFSVQASDRISNYYIGGETNNVFVLSTQGIRNVFFGTGMDDVTMRTDFIDSLQANRGAVGSNVTTSHHIGRMTFGGDVVSTNVLAGYHQQLEQIFTRQTIPTDDPAQSTATINNILIAGDVVDSIFAASVQPVDGAFDSPDALLFPHSHISAKVEGTINNSNINDVKPHQAFFAKQVAVAHGPVNPPNVPQAPFPHPLAAPYGNRIVAGLQPSGPPARVGSAQKAAKARLSALSTLDATESQ